MIKMRPTDKDINGHIELMLEEDPFSNITFYYEGMRMADEENEDGSMNMSFEYTVTSDKKPSDVQLFENTLGDLLLQILEEQLKQSEVIYKGGTNDDESGKVRNSGEVSQGI